MYYHVDHHASDVRKWQERYHALLFFNFPVGDHLKHIEGFKQDVIVADHYSLRSASRAASIDVCTALTRLLVIHAFFKLLLKGIRPAC